MASFGNSPNPWASSYDTYKDCSQGLCSIYCPQWCYIIFPPPPPSFGDFGGDGGSTDFSPLIIAVIGILASAFILLSYYTIIAKYCRRRRDENRESGENERESGGGSDGGDNSAGHAELQAHAEGLEEGLIKAIRVHKYRKGDGLVDVTDCAVCLSEFEENEGLRLLPKCNHAFHVPCIDTWLKSHSSCPLCRANIAPFVAESVVIVTAAMPQVVQGSVPSVVVVVDEEVDSRVGVIAEEEFSGPKIGPIDHDDRTVVGRSASLNIGSGFCSDRLLVADILREEEDDDDEDDDDDGDLVDKRMRLCLGIGTSSRFDDDHGGGDDAQICKWDRSGALGLMRSPLAMRRSISTSRFVFTRYGKGKNSVLPN